MDHDNEELVERAALGSESATRQLLAENRNRLRRMIAVRLDRRLSARLDPSDVVQEVLTVASQRMPAYLKQRPLPFYPWLRSLAWDHLARLHERHVTAHKRSVNREVSWSPELSEDSVMQLADCFAAPGMSPSQLIMRDELRRRVRTALNQLKTSDRELLLLKYLEQLSLGEIAAILSITVTAVKGRHLRALDRLRRQLEDSSG